VSQEQARDLRTLDRADREPARWHSKVDAKGAHLLVGCRRGRK
jgi:hypothetical protein